MPLKSTTYTANVLLAFDESTAQLLSNRMILGGSLGKIFEDIENEVDPATGLNKAYLLGGGPTSNILKFTHEYNFSENSAGGIEKGNIFSLDLLDPEGVFEEIFTKKIASRFNLQDFDQLDLNIGAGSNEAMRREFERLSGEKFSEGFAIGRPVFSTDGINIPKVEFVDEDTTEKVKELQEYITRIQTIWISYGLGNNANDWAGPFAATFLTANLSYPKGGSRVISLQFVANQGVPWGKELEVVDWVHKDETYNLFVPLITKEAIAKNHSIRKQLSSTLIKC